MTSTGGELVLHGVPAGNVDYGGSVEGMEPSTHTGRLFSYAVRPVDVEGDPPPFVLHTTEGEELPIYPDEVFTILGGEILGQTPGADGQTVGRDELDEALEQVGDEGIPVDVRLRGFDDAAQQIREVEERNLPTD